MGESGFKPIHSSPHNPPPSHTYPFTKTMVEIAARSRKIFFHASFSFATLPIHRSPASRHCFLSMVYIKLCYTLFLSPHVSPDLHDLSTHNSPLDQWLSLTPPFRPLGVSTLNSTLLYVKISWSGRSSTTCPP
jgi:hypothetical protein